MKPALVLMCSPHAGGVSDQLAKVFSVALEDAGWPANLVELRAHPVHACTGCGNCAQPPHACILADNDDAEWLFSLFAESPLVLLASSIYFYALPAVFKAWIDRGQRFWAARMFQGNKDIASNLSPAKPVLAVLAAGRPCGEKLFSGALLTLRWFLSPMNAQLVENRVFRGLDQLEDLLGRPKDLDNLRGWGRAWGKRLACESQLLSLTNQN